MHSHYDVDDERVYLESVPDPRNSIKYRCIRAAIITTVAFAVVVHSVLAIGILNYSLRQLLRGPHGDPDSNYTNEGAYSILFVVSVVAVGVGLVQLTYQHPMRWDKNLGVFVAIGGVYLVVVFTVFYLQNPDRFALVQHVRGCTPPISTSP